MDLSLRSTIHQQNAAAAAVAAALLLDINVI